MNSQWATQALRQSDRTAGMWSWLLCRVVIGAALVFICYELVKVLTYDGFAGIWGGDYRLYMGATTRWLAGGSFYQPWQFQPYAISYTQGELGATAILYPPYALALFVPFSFLPAVAWWAIPIATIAVCVRGARGWGLAALLVALALPGTWLIVTNGNPALWSAAFLVAAARYRPVGVFVLLKPTLAPFALVGIRSRLEGAYLPDAADPADPWLPDRRDLRGRDRRGDRSRLHPVRVDAGEGHPLGDVHEVSRGAPALEQVRDPHALAQGRSGGLDLLRIIACEMVLVGHVTHVPTLSRAGLAIFFALSGYLVWKPFTRGAVDLRSYFIRRVARIYPGYMVALIGATIVVGSSDFVGHPLQYALMLQNFDPALAEKFVAPSWSLPIEMAFYLVVPLFALARGYWVAAAVIAGMTSFALAQIPGWGLHLPMLLWAFIPGMLATRLPASRWLALFGAGIVIARLTQGGDALDIIIPIGIGLMIPWLAQARVPSMVDGAGATYGIYLWQWAWFYLIPPVSLTSGLLAMLGATLTGIASWFLVERPVLRWAHRQTGRPAANPVPRATEDVAPA